MNNSYRFENESMFKHNINLGSNILSRFWAIILFGLAILSLASCGGGGGDSRPPSTPPPTIPITPPPTTPPPTTSPGTLPGGPTNRTHPPLRQCNDTVLIDEAGGVVLPSIDTVQIPSGQGTLRMEWNAFSIPDRFVLEVDGRIAIDTQYVGSPSSTISEINQSLSANGLPLAR